MTFNEFQSMISDLSHIPKEEIHESSSFRNDLGIDSLQLVNLLIEVANRFSLNLAVINDNKGFETVGDLYKMIIGGQK